MQCNIDAQNKKKGKNGPAVNLTSVFKAHCENFKGAS